MELFSTWSLIRASGFSAYLLLTLSIIAAVMYSGKMISGRWKASFQLFHQFASWLGFLFELFHGIMLLFDKYEPYSLKGILIPFYADHQPILSGIGTISLYVILLILLTSDFMKLIGKKIWRFIHYLAIPAYILALFHGVFLGTDSSEIWVVIFYASSIILLFALLFVRIFTQLVKKREKIYSK